MIAKAPIPSTLTDRWYPLRRNEPHDRLLEAMEWARFLIACAGRRSGKTEHIKREGVTEAVNFSGWSNGRFIFGAPTQQQAKDIFWDDLKAMVPDWALLGSRRDSILESQPQTIRLFNGASIIVAGLDKPMRIEGPPIDWIALDEFADMKPKVWQESILPAVSTTGRPGRARFIGKPRGRNHYWRLAQDAKADRSGLWSYHHWTSHEVLSAEEVAVLAANMDELTFDQEINANFVNFSGRAYYAYDDAAHVYPVEYVPGLDLVLCFDFNVEPGVALVCQEHPVTDEYEEHFESLGLRAPSGTVTAVLDEVWIPKNSNTERVAKVLARDWKGHKGEVRLYGDPSGGARKSAAVKGSDWDLVTGVLRPVFGHFINEAWPREAPAQRARINATNARLKTAAGAVSALVHPKCKHFREDMEGVTLVVGTGEIDKDDDELTHLSDAFGYYIAERFPIGGRSGVMQF